MRLIKVENEVVQHAGQEDVVVVIEHTNIILNYLGVWNWIVFYLDIYEEVLHSCI